MARIVVMEVPKNRIRSCNNCTARNFESAMFFDGEVVDKIYELHISNSCIALCKDCLRKVSAEINACLSEQKESEGEK